MMTDPLYTQPVPGPAGERSPDLTYDGSGRIASCTEYHPGRGEPKSTTDYGYDEQSLIVRMTQTCSDGLQPSPAP